MKKYLFVLIIFISLSNINCSVYKTFVNLSRLQFKLDSVSNVNLAEINLANKLSISDFSPLDAFKITSAVSKGSLPISFTINILAKNPNDDKGGYSNTNATIKSFPWRLSINDKETISGNIAQPVTVPGKGEITSFPLSVNFDLLKFFKEDNYKSILNLALSIAGVGNTSAKLALYVKPTVTTAMGDISYPDELKVISLDFTN